MIKTGLLTLILALFVGSPGWAASTSTSSDSFNNCCSGTDCGGAREAAMNRDYANELDANINDKFDENDDCITAVFNQFNSLLPSGGFDVSKLLVAACEAVDTTLSTYKNSLSSSLGKWNTSVAQWDSLDDSISRELRALLEKELKEAQSGVPTLNIPDVSPNGVTNALDLLK